MGVETDRSTCKCKIKKYPLFLLQYWLSISLLENTELCSRSFEFPLWVSPPPFFFFFFYSILTCFLNLRPLPFFIVCFFFFFFQFEFLSHFGSGFGRSSWSRQHACSRHPVCFHFQIVVFSFWDWDTDSCIAKVIVFSLIFFFFFFSPNSFAKEQVFDFFWKTIR